MKTLRPGEMRLAQGQEKADSFSIYCFLHCHIAHLVFIKISQLHTSNHTSRGTKEISDMVLTIKKLQYHVYHCDFKQSTTILNPNKHIIAY